jgi:lactobin A/cerein 7B family class IIb bacteriocin
MKNLKLKELTKQELKEINGGFVILSLLVFGTHLGVGIYEHVFILNGLKWRFMRSRPSC